MGVCAIQEASGMLRQIAGNRRADENLKAVLRRVGAKLQGWSASRVRAVWYADERICLRSVEVDELRALAERRETKRTATDDLEALRKRVAKLERLLAANPPVDRARRDADWRGVRELG